MPEKQSKKVGRHLAITAQKRNKIVKLVEEGNYAKTVCQAVGISEPTFYSYINQGEEAEKRGEFNNEFFKFFKLIKQARAKAELRHVENIDINSKHDPKLSQWWLERTAPSRWAKKEYITQDIKVSNTDIVRKWINEHGTKSENINDSKGPVQKTKTNDVSIPRKDIP